MSSVDRLTLLDTFWQTETTSNAASRGTKPLVGWSSGGSKTAGWQGSDGVTRHTTVVPTTITSSGLSRARSCSTRLNKKSRRSYSQIRSATTSRDVWRTGRLTAAKSRVVFDKSRSRSGLASCSFAEGVAAPNGVNIRNSRNKTTSVGGRGGSYTSRKNAVSGPDSGTARHKRSGGVLVAERAESGTALPSTSTRLIRTTANGTTGSLAMASSGDVYSRLCGRRRITRVASG